MAPAIRSGSTSLDGEFEIVRGRETGGEPGLGWVAPAYGHVVPSTTLRLVRRGAAPFTLVTVLIEATERPSIEALTVRVDGADRSERRPGCASIAGEVTRYRRVWIDDTATATCGADMPQRPTPRRRPATSRAMRHCCGAATRATQPDTHVVIVDGSVVRDRRRPRRS